ncbi:hypothetical protein [Zobellia nedashkovskayae]|uniref:hypothetical protein n=1 Tax=Zobellia nedashkovskayae TaxID=2779510 RepID=UPI00188BF713|nr:hypothetical protein [Zobellia nedashkovskayae]
MGTNLKRNISYFLLTAFILLRVVNLHMASHALTDSEMEHCELCTLISSSNQDTPIYQDVLVSKIVKTDFSILHEQKSESKYLAPYHKNILWVYFYNKPPPVIFLG